MPIQTSRLPRPSSLPLYREETISIIAVNVLIMACLQRLIIFLATDLDFMLNVDDAYFSHFSDDAPVLEDNGCYRFEWVTPGSRIPQVLVGQLVEDGLRFLDSSENIARYESADE